MQHGENELLKKYLKIFQKESNQPKSSLRDSLDLKANFSFFDKKYKESLNYLQKALLHDPWNVTYLVQQALALSALDESKININLYDGTLKKLSKNIEKDLDWNDFTEKTRLIGEANLLELNYCRTKIAFLYADGSDQKLRDLVNAACRLDASRSTYDF